MGKLRFAAVISHPTQHHAPLFSLLNRDPGLEVKAFYLTDHGVRESFDPGFNKKFAWNVDLLAGHEYEFLRPGFTPKSFNFRELDSPAIVGALEAYSPHAFWLHGYGSRVNWRALKWARGRAAVIYFGDSELVHPRGAMTAALKRLVLPMFFSRCDAIVTIGDNNESYYRHYGVPGRKLIRGAYPIDVGRFSQAAAQVKGRERDSMRSRYGIPNDAFLLVISGKLEPRKRPLDVVLALARLPGRQSREVHVVMIGEGRLRGDVTEAAARLGVSDRVHLAGFVNQKEIPALLACGDALVMASDMDPHPLAVSEALPAGLPIIVSDRVGCIGPTDTARPGVNAIVYPSGNVDELAHAIGLLLEDEELFERYSRASRQLAPTQDFSCAARAVKTALAALRPRFAQQWRDVDDEYFDSWLADPVARAEPLTAANG